MGKLFPCARVNFSKIETDGSISAQWGKPALDMRAKVVCKVCNESWMSDIEARHGKPAMSGLILGKQVKEITADQAHSISLFAFKTAIIANQMLPKDEEFFDISQRYAFRESLLIPPDIRMWLFGFEPENAGGIRSRSVYFPNKHATRLTLNICSFYVGQFGFQVVSATCFGVTQIESLPTPDDLTVLFYPAIKPRVSWPRNVVLGREAFDGFAARWDKVKFS